MGLGFGLGLVNIQMTVQVYKMPDNDLTKYQDLVSENWKASIEVHKLVFKILNHN